MAPVEINPIFEDDGSRLPGLMEEPISADEIARVVKAAAELGKIPLGGLPDYHLATWPRSEADINVQLRRWGPVVEHILEDCGHLPAANLLAVQWSILGLWRAAQWSLGVTDTSPVSGEVLPPSVEAARRQIAAAGDPRVTGSGGASFAVGAASWLAWLLGMSDLPKV